MQYKTGQVSTTANSNIITGTGTEWLSWISVGDLFLVQGDNAVYTISSVDSDTQITLTANYPSTNANVPYEITTDFTVNRSYPLTYKQDRDIHAVLRDTLSKIDTDIQNNINNTTTISTRYTQTSSANIIKNAAGDTALYTDASQTNLYQNNGNLRFTMNGSYTSLLKPVNGHGFVIFDTVYQFRNSADDSKNTFTIDDNKMVFIHYDGNGNADAGIYWNFQAGRSYLAPYENGNWNWNRELSYTQNPVNGRPSWTIEQPAPVALTLNSGTQYPGYQSCESFMSAEGLVTIMMMIKITTAVANTGTIATIAASNHRPNNTVIVPALYSGNAGDIRIYSTGEIKNFSGSTLGVNSWVAISFTFIKGL